MYMINVRYQGYISSRNGFVGGKMVGEVHPR